MAVIISLITKLDDRGIAKTQKRLAEMGSAAKGFGGSVAADMIKAGAALDVIGQKTSAVGKSMTMFVSAPIVAGLGLATKAAMDEAREMALLENVLRRNTGATEAQAAAVERWITKTQNATGIADGELRPALSALVAVTKDTSKAQDLLGVAMDIATAKGKPVVTIAEGLAKAQNGNIDILSRYGIATKNAAGETLSFDQILQNASKTFGGSAAAAAETAAGKAAITQAKLADLSETIGSFLLPFVEKATAWIQRLVDRFSNLSDGTKKLIVKVALIAAALGPVTFAFGKLTSGVGKTIKVLGNVGLAFGKNAKAAPLYARAIAGLTRGMGSLAKGAASGVAAMGRWAAAQAVAAAKTIANTTATVASRVAQVAAATAAKAMAAAQWLLNAAMSANPIGIVVTALAALGAALAVAWKKSETFRRILTAAWNAIKAAAKAVFDFLVGFFRSWVERVRSVLSGIKAVVSAIIGFFASIKDGVVAAFRKLTSWLSGLGRRILTAVGNLGRLLWDVGWSIIKGLWNGAKAMWEKVKNWFIDIGRKIKSFFTGIFSTTPSPRGITITRGGGGYRRGGGAIILVNDTVAAGLGLAGYRSAYATAGGGSGSSSRPVTIARGAVQVNVTVGGGGDSAAVTTAVQAGIDPALQRLARAIAAL